MIKKILLIGLVLFSIRATYAQCEGGTFVFNSQASIDSFADDFPDCTLLSGITISGPDITDLSGLSQITEITQSVTVQDNPLLVSMDGLSTIDFILFGSLTVVNNPALERISAFTGTANMRQITIGDNPVLTDLSGLSGISTLTENLVIRDNASLANLNGLENMQEVGISFRIERNPALENLLALTGLQGPVGRLAINDNDLLVDLQGLENLVIVDDVGFNIFNNDNLQSLNGLQNVTSDGVSDFSVMTMLNNSSLNDISAINNWDSNLVERLIISGNPSLSLCANDFVCEMTIKSEISFAASDNAPGCSSKIEVQSNCGDCPTTDVVLDSQAAVDSFFIDYPGCFISSFALQISGSDITDLSPLNGLLGVQSLVITDNPLLTNLNGLESLESLLPEGFGLQITNNALLEDISALSGISGTVGSFILIQDNPLLLSLNGLQNIIRPSDDDVIIINNDALSDLQGLNGITTTDDMIIRDNDGLISLSGLDNFQFTGTLEVSANALLENMNGLLAFETIFGLQIFDNPVLNDISGLSAVSFDPGYLGLTITNNPSLATCNTDPICNLLAVASEAEVVIENNAAGCDVREEVEDACAVCPTGDISLTSQAEIDAFPMTYLLCDTFDVDITISGPDIADLSGLAQIEVMGGQLIIENNPNLVNFDGLGPISFNTGGLFVVGNPSLESLSTFSGVATGFGITLFENDNLTDITGLSGVTEVFDLFVDSNNALTSLNGLEGLTTVYGILQIRNSPLLTDLLPLSNVVGEAEEVVIINNDLFTDLSGLEGLTTITSTGINIRDNESLTSLSGLENITNETVTPFFGIDIWNNTNLVDISAINNMNPNAVAGLGILNNPNLSVCDNEFVCSYLALGGPPFLVDIEGNAPGCESLEQVQASCAVCPTEVLLLDSQAAIDSFAETYVFCDTIPFGLTISGSDITDLSPLAQIEFVSGSIVIDSNPLLESLTGLEGILFPSGFAAEGSDINVIISGNSLLNDISALNDLDPAMVLSLTITNNPNLAVCNNEFVCGYLETGMSVAINNNAPASNCETLEAVLESCGLSVSEFDFSTISLSPNPTEGVFSIHGTDGSNLIEVQLYSLSGQKLMQVNRTVVDVSGLAAGIYFVQIKTDAGIAVKRLIKQ
jgi:hypothetical protein